jgi:hypothetical protein
MGTDYYAETRRIAQELRDEGLLREAQELQDAMDRGATATEILMGVRWQLRQSDSANETRNFATKRSIQQLLSDLDRELS